MRNIMQTVSATSVSNLLVKSFEHMRELLILQGRLDKMSIYMPLHVVFEILEECLLFRLSRPQLTAMVALCPCFDRTNTRLDYKAFAQYAGKYIQNFSSAHHQYQRSYVMTLISKDFNAARHQKHGTPTITEDEADADVKNTKEPLRNEYEEFILNGVSEKDVDKYLIDEFLLAEDNRGVVSQGDFMKILNKIPRVVLTDKDGAALSAAFPHTDNGMIQWQEFVPWAYSSISALVLEHMIARRLSILDFDNDISASEDANTKCEDLKGSDKGSSSGGAAASEPKESKLQKTLEEACDLLRIREVKETDDVITEGAMPKIHEKVIVLWPFDEDTLPSDAVRRAQSEDHEDEDMATVASLDSLGVDQGMNEAETELFSGNYSIDLFVSTTSKAGIERKPLAQARQ